MTIDNTSSSIPNRVDRLRKAMNEAGMDAILCSKPENSFHLTGFNLIINSRAVIAVLTQTDLFLIISGLHEAHAKATPGPATICTYGNWFEGQQSMGATWQEALTTLLAGKHTIGIEHSYISLSQFNEFQKILPEVSFPDADSLIKGCRDIKDPDEIQNARIASHLCMTGFDAGHKALLAGGHSEQEIFVAAKKAMYDLWMQTYPEVEISGFGSSEGGQFDGFDLWVLSGRRKLYNSDGPTTRIPPEGDTVMFAFWATANGMRVELERTVCRGEMPQAERKLIDDNQAIQDAVIDIIQPGTPCNTLYEMYVRLMKERGYGNRILPRIGHGIGYGAHEALSIDAVNKTPLAPGMIITMEPHIMIYNATRTMISDTILVTREGREILTRF
ncbi:hypothetical protein BDV24DRAFT_174358 [Aspergillus arachidicola]|uniref:Probable Xaa-Pro aminopeptidase P n=1 Tax=Aspergillus arachidicola TaxID=656916 RepID=A0A5N6YDL8_9EURO|nr:hypothetical protein BDV24DRAFT_174358 [Aspergillus arachidicola]